MNHHLLGRTGVSVSQLCLGAMMFGAWGNPDHDESIRIIHAALDAGINFVDTADVYSRGESEEIVGKALADGRRDSVFLATKVHGKMGDDPNQFGNSRRWITAEVDNSLRRLGTDWIDLYQIHRPELETDIDETLSALTDLVTAGKGGDVDRLAVDVGAVEAADVVHREAAALAVELHVPPADGDVVQEDVAVGVPAGGGDVLVEQEPATGVRTALDDEQGRSGRERLDGAGVGVGGRLGGLGLLAGVLPADLGDHAGRLADALGRERRAALRAEATALGVLVSTSSAVHVASPPVRGASPRALTGRGRPAVDGPGGPSCVGHRGCGGPWSWN